ncbi:hypothetical protein BT96DRAFT_1007515 [Gymnopus androsaceus JB14]|uniref:Uncharacterized protein n=1 Tax=Gymnopus androsaceus JB14 TaxID=1447944 RepID=A0A6A4GHC2_9AGAR|nr:hypothetical protein BT96DRAFT_1007515 [Gymnopus androsaceus JB14]
MLPTVTSTKTTAKLIAEMATTLKTLRQKEAKEKAQEEAERREKEEAERKVEEQWKAKARFNKLYFKTLAKAEVVRKEKEKQEAERKAREKRDEAERKAQAKKKKEIKERRKRLAAAADRHVSALDSVASTMVDAHPPKKIKKSKEVINSKDKERTEPKTKHTAGKRKQDAVGGDPSNSDPNANGSNDNADNDDKPASKKPKMEVCKRCATQKEACVPASGSSSVCARCMQAKVACSLSGKLKKKGELEAGDLLSQLLRQILSRMLEPKDESGEATENEKDEEEKKRRVKEGKKKAP